MATIPGQTQPRKQYDTATKLKIVQEAEATSVHHAAKKFGVVWQNIRRWLKSASALQQLHGTSKRLAGAGRRIEWEELDMKLEDRILVERSQQLRVTRKLIMEWASEMKTRMQLEVTICPSWVSRFMEKRDFVLSEGTRKSVLHDEEILNRGYLFILNVRRLLATAAIETKAI